MKKLFLFFVFTLTLLSCSDNIINIIPSQLSLDPDNELTLDDIYGEVDTSDITGMFYLKSEYKEIYFLEDDTEEIETNENLVEVYFFNPDDHSDIYESDSIFINNTLLEEVSPSSYYYAAQGDIIASSGITLYFGSSANDIVVVGNSDIPSIDTSVSLTAAIRITSYELGDTIDTGQALNLAWTGTNSHYVQITIMKQMTTFPPTSVYIGEAITDNDGTFTISSTIMSNFPDGIYDITITGIEPKIIELSTGDNIAVIGMPTHKISVYFEN